MSGEERRPVRTVRIEETTVGTIDGWRVTVGNILRDRFVRADGASAVGLTAEVGVYDEDMAARAERTVGEGAALEIAGRRWTVARVEPGPAGDNGFVELVCA